MKLKGILVAVAVFFSTVTFAGYKQPQNVAIDMDAQTAIGDMLSAANSKSPDETIGCGTRTFDDGLGNSYQWGFCQATDADGNYVTCTVYDNDNLLTAMRSLSDFSFIIFSWADDGAGNLTCTYVGSSTQSLYLQKIKD